MTKDDVLQKVNDYCSEKSYTSETLTEDYKEQFAEFFAKKHGDKSMEDDGILDDMKFNLNTAFSAASKGITRKVRSFEEKESEYKRQIEALSKGGNKGDEHKQEGGFEMPKALQEKLDRLEAFEKKQILQDKKKEIISIAKKSIRQDLHKSLENYAKDFTASVDEASDEQAKKLTARFQEIFKDSIGDIKPLAPRKSKEKDDEFIASLPKLKV